MKSIVIVLVVPSAAAVGGKCVSTGIDAAQKNEAPSVQGALEELLAKVAGVVTERAYVMLISDDDVDDDGEGVADMDSLLRILQQLYCAKPVAFLPRLDGQEGNTNQPPSNPVLGPLKVQVVLPTPSLAYEGSPALSMDTTALLVPSSLQRKEAGTRTSLDKGQRMQEEKLARVITQLLQTRSERELPPLTVHHYDDAALETCFTPVQAIHSAQTKLAPKRVYSGVVVGGTFDRLHPGHQLLLSSALAVLAPAGPLLVGIATGPLLQRKTLSELLESYECRSVAVEAFLRSAAGPRGAALDLTTVPITEAAPEQASSDPRLGCVVVSAETETGARLLNEARARHNVPALDILTIASVTSSGSPDLEKLSSSLLRRQSLGTLLSRLGDHSVPPPRLHRASRTSHIPPFIVGLTGGIASGKTLVREVLVSAHGALACDCDALGHRSYARGTPTHAAVIAAFGPSIVRPDHEIDRAALGTIVFSDPTAMARLTSIVWPAIAQMFDEEVVLAGQQGHRVLVAETSVLFEAGWEGRMDEVWVVFAARDTAKDRLMSRNRLSSEQADQRINAQMSASDRVALADVAICNSWEKEKTMAQVAKAWSLLQSRVIEFEQRQAEDPPLKQSSPVARQLSVRWSWLMWRMGVSDDVAVRWWEVLHDLYCENGRHYHTLDHVHRMFEIYHSWVHFVRDPHALHLAIFFHDAIYDPTAKAPGANERSSAALFGQFVQEAALAHTPLPPQTVADVERWILRTANHLQGPAVGGDEAWFLDFDLAILGADNSEYEAYSAGVGKEYCHVDRKQYCEKRALILESMLGHEYLFFTEQLRMSLEGKARGNMLKEIEGLQKEAKGYA